MLTPLSICVEFSRNSTTVSPLMSASSRPQVYAHVLHCLLLWFIAYLFIIQPGCECEHSCLRVEWEHVVSPVGDDGVSELGIWSWVEVNGRHGANHRTSRSIFGNVERICAFFKYWRIVVCVSNLKINMIVTNYNWKNTQNYRLKMVVDAH